MSTNTILSMALAAAFSAPAFGYSTAELNNGAYLKQDSATAVTTNATGVKIAVIDTGLNAKHREYTNLLTSGRLTCYNVVTATLGCATMTDKVGHGTGVMGLVAASNDGYGVVGMANGANVAAIKVYNDSGVTTTNVVDTGLYASQVWGAKIVNLSMATPVSYNSTQLRSNVNSGQLLVIAAGNAGGANPLWPAQFAKESWANGQIIAVGAVDSKNNIASFSNRAGNTANWFMVAPGTGVMSTGAASANSYGINQGTSFAAPQVTAAAGLVWQQWSYLSARQVGDILLSTATDLGAPGTDAIYGRGLLNVAAAMNPVGKPKTYAKSGIMVTNFGGYTASATTYSAFAAAAKVGVQAFDDYGRNFTVTPQVQAAPSYASAEVLANTSQRFSIVERIDNGVRYMAVVDTSLRDANAPVAMSFNGETERLAWSGGTGGTTNNFFGGLNGTPFATMNFLSGALKSPAMSLVPNQTHMGLGYKMGNQTVKFGLMTERTLAQNAAAAVDPNAVKFSSTGTTVEFSHAYQGGAMAMSITAVSEDRALLGGRGTNSMFGQTGRPASTFATWSIGERVAPKTYVAGMFTYGITKKTSDANSIISGMSDVVTTAWSAGLVREDAWKTGDRVSFAVSQPMKIVNGSMSVDAVTGVTETGAPVRTVTNVNMASPKTEHALEATYFRPLDRTSSINYTAVYRMNPNHTDAAPVIAIGARYQVAF